MRRSRLILAAGLIGCTDLTGASDLSVGENTAPHAGSVPSSGTSGAPAPTTTPSTTTPPGAPRPAAFDFADVTGADLMRTYTTSAKVGGFSGALTATVTGADAQVRTPTTSFGSSLSVVDGDTIEIRMTSSKDPGTRVTATMTIAGVVVDWNVTTQGSCAVRAVEWTQEGKACSVSSGAVLAPGATRDLSDSEGPDTGTVRVTCTGGELVTSNPLCEPPRVINVAGASGCVNGYCSAALGGMCATPDPAKASAICAVKRYRVHTAYEVTAGPLGVPQCNADGSSCFTNANPLCNIVFTSVTCIH